MEWVETTGKTIDEAKESALDELGVDEQDAEFEVLEEPKVGLFGRIRSEGRIRARVRPTTPRAKEDRRDRRRRSKAGSEGGAPAAATTASAGPADTAPAPAARPPRAPRSAQGRGDAGRTAEPSAPDAGGDDAEAVAPAGPRTNPSRRRGGRGGSRPAAGPGRADASERGATSEPVAAGVSSSNGDGPGPEASRPPRSRNRKRSGANRSPAASTDAGFDDVEGTLMDVALDEQGKVAEQFLSGLVDSFGVSAQIAVNVPDDETIDIQVTGEDLGLLIGPKGATLLAIQDITRTVVQRKTSAGNGRIFIDVSGYRQKRNEALTRFAHKVASDVISSQTRMALEPMSAPDRKTVHDAITEIEGVETISEGEDANRHVVVLPAGA